VKYCLNKIQRVEAMNFNQLQLMTKKELNRGLIWVYHKKFIKQSKNQTNNEWHYRGPSLSIIDIYSQPSVFVKALGHKITIASGLGDKYWCEWTPIGGEIIVSPEVSSPYKAAAQMLLYIYINYRDCFNNQSQ